MNDSIPSGGRRLRPLHAFLILCLILVLISTGAIWVARAQAAERIAAAVGRAVPEIEVESLADGLTSTRSLEGKVTILRFVRTSCGRCKAEHSTVEALALALDPDRERIVSVLVDPLMGGSRVKDRSGLDPQQFAHEAWWGNAALLNAFHGARWARITPLSYVINAQGKVVSYLRGSQTLNTYQSALSAAR